MAYNKTPFKMMGKSPLMKALVGKQGNLPMHLQEKIKAAPESPAKKHYDSPAKKYKSDAQRKAAHASMAEQSPAKQMSELKKNSPVKQVKVKDLPEKAVETGEKIIKGVKKIGKKIGNITLISKERQECKKAGGRFKKGTCYMPQKPSPVKQTVSKKQMKFEKTAQKAENAVQKGNMSKNARLVKKGNKMNKKNNLGNDKLAQG